MASASAKFARLNGRGSEVGWLIFRRMSMKPKRGDVRRRLNGERALAERGERKLYCGGERGRGITLITRGPGILFQTTRRHFCVARAN